MRGNASLVLSNEAILSLVGYCWAEARFGGVETERMTSDRHCEVCGNFAAAVQCRVSPPRCGDRQASYQFGYQTTPTCAIVAVL